MKRTPCRKMKQMNQLLYLKKLTLFSDNKDMNCKCYTTEQFKENGVDKNSKNMSLLHLKISSLPYHIREFTTPINNLKTNFKIIGITESRLNNKKERMNTINVPNYNIEHLLNSISKSGALLYISKELKYKNQKKKT